MYTAGCQPQSDQSGQQQNNEHQRIQPKPNKQRDGIEQKRDKQEIQRLPNDQQQKILKQPQYKHTKPQTNKTVVI